MYLNNLIPRVEHIENNVTIVPLHYSLYILGAYLLQTLNFYVCFMFMPQQPFSFLCGFLRSLKVEKHKVGKSLSENLEGKTIFTIKPWFLFDFCFTVLTFPLTVKKAMVVKVPVLSTNQGSATNYISGHWILHTTCKQFFKKY